MKKTVIKKLKLHAAETWKEEWGCTPWEYYKDIKKHYKLTGKIGFSVEVADKNLTLAN